VYTGEEERAAFYKAPTHKDDNLRNPVWCLKFDNEGDKVAFPERKELLFNEAEPDRIYFFRVYPEVADNDD